MRDLLFNGSFGDDPCFGCLSASCRTCICAGERETRDYVTDPANRKEIAPSKENMKQKTDSFEELLKNAKKRVKLPTSLFGELNGAFIFTANGDGMKNASILTGDEIIFEKDLKPSDGDIVAGKFNGAMMCRRVFFEGEYVRVRREDGETPDIVTTDYEIFGVMVGLARNCRRSA